MRAQVKKEQIKKMQLKARRFTQKGKLLILKFDYLKEIIDSLRENKILSVNKGVNIIKYESDVKYQIT